MNTNAPILTRFRIVYHNYRFLTLMCMVYAGGAVSIGLMISGVLSWWWLAAAWIWSKFIQLIGHNIGLHRYISHRSFHTTKFWHRVMCWCSVLLATGSPIAYARNHRVHHRVSDTVDDWHSPVNDGVLGTMFGQWQFHRLSWFLNKKSVLVKDWIRDPDCRFIDQNYYLIWIALIAVGSLIDWRLPLCMLMLPAFIHHIEINSLINAFGHQWGYRNFDTNDQSHNNKLTNWLTLGEGLHNNHHANPAMYNNAVRADEFDPSAWFIRNLMLTKSDT